MIRNPLKKLFLLKVLLAGAVGLPAIGWAADSENFVGKVDMTTEIAAKANPNGALFVFAKKVGEESAPPAAVIRIDHPQYPVTFRLRPEDQMRPGDPAKPFEGEYILYARHSDTGTPMEKKGYHGESCGSVVAGEGSPMIVISSEYEE